MAELKGKPIDKIWEYNLSHVEPNDKIMPLAPTEEQDKIAIPENKASLNYVWLPIPEPPSSIPNQYVWNFQNALDLIRPLQTIAKQYHYHVCLGGSVLNKGSSTKDLDLYFLPLNHDIKPNASELLHNLSNILGEGKVIGQDYPDHDMPYIRKLKFNPADVGRIDVFVLGSQEDLEALQAAPAVSKDLVIEIATNHIINKHV